jgi:hypothetical protein
LEFQGHWQTFLRYFVNGKEVARTTEHDPKTITMNLNAGWNQVGFRGYCVGYPPFHAGVVIKGAVDKLWTVKLSATPPS